MKFIFIFLFVLVYRRTSYRCRCVMLYTAFKFQCNWCCKYCRLNFTETFIIADLFEYTASAGGFDILVNAAAIMNESSMWRRMIDINLVKKKLNRNLYCMFACKHKSQHQLTFTYTWDLLNIIWVGGGVVSQKLYTYIICLDFRVLDSENYINL